MSDEQPRLFYGKYIKLGHLGKGANAQVYKVKHAELGYVYALKILNDHIESKKDKAYLSFEKECKTLLAIGRHPYIVGIWEPDLINNQAVVPMDFIEGVTLNEYIRRQGFVEYGEICKFIEEIVDALAYTHHDIYKRLMNPEDDDLTIDPQDGSKYIISEEKERELVKKYGIEHNDLHSGNIMRRTNDGRFVLLDFGLAVQDGECVKSSRQADGCPEYCPPEKFDGGVITAASDVYSLGVLLYELLAGRPPFVLERGTGGAVPYSAMMRIIREHQTQSPPPILPLRRAAFERKHPGAAYERDYPQWLDEVVMKCLAKSPSDRYPDAKALQTDIARHQAEEKIINLPPISDDEWWAQALKADNYESYHEYLRRYKDGAHREEAQSAINKIEEQKFLIHEDEEWQSACTKNTISAYNHFIALYSDNKYKSIHIEEARQRLSELMRPKPRRKWHIWLPIVFLLALGATAYYQYQTKSWPFNAREAKAEEVDSLQWAIDNQDIPLLTRYAELDSIRAYFPLYLALLDKEPEKTLSPEGMKWIFKAAEQGDAGAQYVLGSCYDCGEGVPQSYIEAAKWHRQAAEHGLAPAECRLGGMYYAGQGVEQSYKEAVYWYRKAVEQGYEDAEALCNLGVCYYYGDGVEQSYTEAVHWYRKAAEQGDAAAQYNLGICYYHGRGVEQSYTEAVCWYRKAAEQEYTDAQNNLGVCYLTGEGVEQSYSKAANWWQRAADRGDADAQYNMGLCYKNGQGVEKDLSAAQRWFELAAIQGHDAAKNMLKELKVMHK